MIKKIFSIAFLMIGVISSISFADTRTTKIVTTASKGILNAMSWFGYAIAIIVLIFIGMKYVLSGANEKANLKGKIKYYLIGVALIVLCSGIAQGVAEIAGNQGATEIVEMGMEQGNITIQDGEDTGE